WSEREEALAAELEEAKIRVAQMEKTMRWWSDCTSNWREKWNKARGERNKAKDENRLLRAKLEALAKEVTRLRRERKEALAQEKNVMSPSNEDQADSQLHAIPTPSSLTEDGQNSGNKSSNSQGGLSEKEKTVIAGTDEKEEKNSHMELVEQLQVEVKTLKSSLEEEKQGKQETIMQMDKVKTQHQDELSRLTLDLEDEANSRSTMDKQVSELRRDLERIQAENASEWAKRERLESEKLALERDNKKLRAQVTDLEEELQKRSQATSSIVDSDLKTLQFELTENQKELSDVRHSQVKLRKVLGERGTELEHTRRRAEQYQDEVRKLRGRVEELKHDLAAAEDEV
ncbi:hypothetical protein EGW08_023072, partial [Elysia chlorotica]